MITAFLRWADIALRTPIDEPAIAGVVRPLIADAAKARGPRYRDALQDNLERELMAAFGAWVAGWSWGASEPGGGGPIHGWCCAEHSLFPVADDPAGGPRTDLADADDDPVGASTARVVRSVLEWQQVLDELAAMYAELGAEAERSGDAIAVGVERAASRLLPWVLHRTHAEDAWYATFAKLLAWYVEAAGYEIEGARPVIYETISGVFYSWMEPTPEQGRAACADLGKAIARLEDDSETTDATAKWLGMRAGAFGQIEQLVHQPVRVDGHLRYIDTRDQARDAERAERMRAALMLCRDSARRGMALTFDQMCEWQAAVLGEQRVELRTGAAFAKGGRERYGDLERARFDNLLADAAGEGSIALRAARVYLDVCFCHPFADGNARAARLALDHVLTRAGYALHVAEPAFIVSRTIEDRLVGWSLARVLERLIGPIAF